MSKKLVLCLACLFLFVGIIAAQTSRKVSGIVTAEEDGQPIVGASVLVKGTSIGTVTDVDGRFAIPNVPSSAKTLITF